MVSKYKTKFKQTEIGMIPEDWNVKELGNLSDFQYGLGESAQKKGDFVYIRITDINSDGFLDKSSLVFMDKEKVKEKYILKKGDVLVARTGASFGKTYRFNEDLQATYGGFLIKLLFNKNRIDNNFYFQFSRSKIYWDQANNLVGGGAQPQFNANVLSKMIVPCPGLSEQQSIAKILSSPDSKVELNHRINKMLETIGQALFKRWFVDFEFPNEKGKPYKSYGGEMVDSELGDIPKGWRAGKLSELLENSKISLKAGESLVNRNYVPIDCLSMKKIGLETYLPYTEAKSSLIAFEKNDILVGAMRIYFHRVCLAPFSGVTRTTTFVLRPKIKEYLCYSLLLLNRDETIDYANMHSKGTTMPYAVWDGSLAEMRTIIPNKEIIEKFNKLYYPLIVKIRDSIYEQERLSQIRDSLLPRLMSGKIRVPIEARG